MKKLFAIVAVMGVLTFGSTQLAQAQDAPAAEQTEQAAVAPAADAAAPAAMEAAEGGIHKELKTKFIEGTASFMSLVAIALVIGLAFCIERIIYLSLAEINTKKFLAAIEAALEKGDVEAAKDIARNTRDQTLVVDRSNRTSGVTCDVFSSFNITFFQSSFDRCHEFFCVDFSQAQIDDTFDTESQTDYQSNSNQTHERCSTFNEFNFDFFVNTTFFCSRSSGRSSLSSSRSSLLFSLFCCRSILSLSKLN